jgi:hypothetical protein
MTETERAAVQLAFDMLTYPSDPRTAAQWAREASDVLGQLLRTTNAHDIFCHVIQRAPACTCGAAQGD